VLIIGYGNDLRGDDGVGPKTVEAVAALELPGVQCRTCHQLTPELAETISRASRVVFVDAGVESGESVEVAALSATEDAAARTHAVSPAALLAMARELYGKCPPAWLVTIPIESTAHGESLTPLAQRGMCVAIDRIKLLAAEFA